MQFFLFDVSATLSFLLGYLTIVNLQQHRRALVVVTAVGRVTSAGKPGFGPELPTPSAPQPDPAQTVRPTAPPRRGWPRLSAPR